MECINNFFFYFIMAGQSMQPGISWPPGWILSSSSTPHHQQQLHGGVTDKVWNKIYDIFLTSMWLIDFYFFNDTVTRRSMQLGIPLSSHHHQHFVANNNTEVAFEGKGKKNFSHFSTIVWLIYFYFFQLYHHRWPT